MYWKRLRIRYIIALDHSTLTAYEKVRIYYMYFTTVSVADVSYVAGATSCHVKVRFLVAITRQNWNK